MEGRKLRVLAVDPGRAKCGLAVVDGAAGVLANSANVSASETDLNSGNNSTTVMSTVNLPVADVSIDRRALRPMRLAAPSTLQIQTGVSSNSTLLVDFVLAINWIKWIVCILFSGHYAYGSPLSFRG